MHFFVIAFSYRLHLKLVRAKIYEPFEVFCDIITGVTHIKIEQEAWHNRFCVEAVLPSVCQCLFSGCPDVYVVLCSALCEKDSMIVTVPMFAHSARKSGKHFGTSTSCRSLSANPDAPVVQGLAAAWHPGFGKLQAAWPPFFVARRHPAPWGRASETRCVLSFAGCRRAPHPPQHSTLCPRPRLLIDSHAPQSLRLDIR